MRIFLLLILVLVIVACNFETKKISSEEVLDQETKTLNWKEVDEYPAFENCKNITEINKAKTCFETTVANSVYAYLSKKEPVVTEAIDDTLLLYLKVTKEGQTQIDSLVVDSLVTNQIPEIKMWLQQSIDSLPKIYPASKRGIPVSTTFKMPILIKAE